MPVIKNFSSDTVNLLSTYLLSSHHTTVQHIFHHQVSWKMVVVFLFLWLLHNQNQLAALSQLHWARHTNKFAQNTKFVLPNCQKKTKWGSFLASDFKLWLIQSTHNLTVYQSFTLKININVLVPSLLLNFTDSFPLVYKDTSSFRTKAYITRIESLACTRMWLSHPDLLSSVLRISRLNQFIHLLSIK